MQSADFCRNSCFNCPPFAHTRSSLNIPFPTARHAQIAYDVLRIDPEPARNAVRKQLRLAGSQLDL